MLSSLTNSHTRLFAQVKLNVNSQVKIRVNILIFPPTTINFYHAKGYTVIVPLNV